MRLLPPIAGAGLLAVLVIVALALLPGAAAADGQRRAMVVGIDSYDALPDLQKAVNDAVAVSATLQALGFEVVQELDPDRRRFNMRLNEFLSTLSPGDEAVFYFAGHGVEIDGRNYLLPRDVPAATAGQEAFVTAESIAVDRVIELIRWRGARVSLLILDACRDNPFPRPPGRGAVPLGGSRGLGAMSVPEGAFILYSAGIGQQALDALDDVDPDPNSVFTRRLLPLMAEPGLPLPDLARRVRSEVQALAATVAHDQRPAYYDDLSGEFAFNPAPVPPVATPAPLPPSDPVAATCDILYREAREIDACFAFEAYLATCEEHPFRPLAEAYVTARCSDPAAAADQPPAPPPQPPLPTVIPAAPAPPAAASLAEMSCEQLWVARNRIFHEAGYCFQTERARSFFGNEGCTTTNPTLSSADEARVEEIRRMERSRGC